MEQLPSCARDFPGFLQPFLTVGVARPETWGPPTWDALIHMLNAVGTPTQASFEDGQVIFILTQSEAAQLRDRLRVFGQLLPCPRCASHFDQALDAIDVNQAVMQTRAGWLDWMTRQKDKVNALYGKATHSPEARAQFCRDVITLTGRELWMKRAAEKKKCDPHPPARSSGDGRREADARGSSSRKTDAPPSRASSDVVATVVGIAIIAVVAALIIGLLAPMILKFLKIGNRLDKSESVLNVTRKTGSRRMSFARRSIDA